MQPQCCVSFVSVRDEPTKKDSAKIDVSPYGEPVDDIGLLQKHVSPCKTKAFCNSDSEVGAYWVHSKDGCIPWDQLRALIMQCEDLPQVTRGEFVRQGDKAAQKR